MVKTITLKRDKDNEKHSGGVILLSYNTYLKNGDIVFANIINEQIKGDNIYLEAILPDDNRLKVAFVGAVAETVLRNIDSFKRSIIRYFGEKGFNVKLKE